MGKGDIRRICIYGVGGVGGFFGGKIAQAIHDRLRAMEVYFIARGAHLQAIQARGLVLNTTEAQGLVCRPTLAVEDFGAIPRPDLILLCVKGYDLDDVVEKIAENVQDDTVILPLLNGVDIYQRIRKKLEKGIVLPACVYVGTHIAEPGVVNQNGGNGMILMGGDPKVPGWNPSALTKLFDDVGILYQWHRDARPAIWEKYMFIAGFGLVGAAHNRSLGEIMADATLQEEVRDVMEEIRAIAVKQGIHLRGTIIDDSLQKGAHFPYETKTSFQRDLEHGIKNEGDLFVETLIRLGKAHETSTAVSEQCAQLINERFGKD